MKDVKDITCCVIDHGLFLPLAHKLAETYKRVLYWTPAEKDFPLLNDAVIGDGFERIERCDDFWKVKREIDLFVFPDVQHSGLQLELEQQGFPVWGSREGDILELDRELFLKKLKDVGLEVPPFTVKVGLTELREHLLTARDKYIKVSRYRGSFETVHWRNYREDSGMLDKWAFELGLLKELVRFIVCDNIPTELEIGGDTYNVRGAFPKKMIHGLEDKDKGYFGSVLKTAEMPEQIRAVNEAFAPWLAKKQYTNLWSAEVRVKDEHSFFIDPCCRFSSPGNSSQMRLYHNLAEIILAGAHGELEEPETTDEFALECVLKVKGEKDGWRIVELPKELEAHVNFRGSCQEDGLIGIPPHEAHGDEVGWLGTTAGTIPDLIEDMKRLVKLLPDGVSADTEAIFKLVQEAHEAEDQGIGFTDQEIPEPGPVLADMVMGLGK